MVRKKEDYASLGKPCSTREEEEEIEWEDRKHEGIRKKGRDENL